MRPVKEFEGGYGWPGKIWVELHKCTICGQEKICIASDASENEYNYAWLCPDCVKKECEKGV